MFNTDKLESFALFLRNDVQKITDALFVENLINHIKSNPQTTANNVENWLIAALVSDKPYNDYNCIEVYNFSFYLQLRDKY